MTRMIIIEESIWSGCEEGWWLHRKYNETDNFAIQVQIQRLAAGDEREIAGVDNPNGSFAFN